MFISGHVSASYITYRLTRLSPVFLTAAAVFPDAVDKGLRFAGLFSSGRHVAHNLIALALTALLVAAWRGRKPALAWATGYALHLVGDIPFSWAMPWFYPFGWGAWHHTEPEFFLGMSAGQLVLDLCVSLAALGLFVLERRRRRPAGR